MPVLIYKKACRIAVNVTVLILLIVFTAPLYASACTIFTASDENLVLVGNNEDFYYTYESRYWITKGDEENYGRICFAISSYVQGGMNEKGLFYDGATCPDTKIPNDINKETLGINAGEVVLSKCANVQEAVDFLKQYNISNTLGDHLLFADADGNAAVVEWVENEMKVIWAEDNRLVATNFFLSNKSLGGYPCKRYDTVVKELDKPDSVSLSSFADILKQTTQSWDGAGTKYSNIYDLKALTVYVYNLADFSKSAAISLKEELNVLSAGEEHEESIDKLHYEVTPRDIVKEGSNVGSNTQNESFENSQNNDYEIRSEKKFDFYWIAVAVPVLLVLFILIKKIYANRKPK